LPGASNGGGRRTRFADPFGVVLDQDGNLYVADGGDNNTIRKIDMAGASTVLAGGTEGYAEGKGSVAAFNTPSGMAIDAAGNLYVADTGNNAIRKITPDGTVSTLAGDGLAGDKDGKGAGAQFNGPVGVAVDAAGNVYVADTYNDRIRRIAPDGTVTTIAGGKRAGNADGPAAQALFDTPTGLAINADGELFIADTANHAIRKLGKDGNVSTIAAARKTTAIRCCARRSALH
jgi:streptogramin lyase